MKKPTNVLYSISIVFLLFINYGACGKGMRGCAVRHADDVASHADDFGKGARHVDDIPPGATNEAKKLPNALNPVDNISKVLDDEAVQTKEVQELVDGSYTYENNTYSRFDEIPFAAGDVVNIARNVSLDEAAYLMRRGVKFIYNGRVLQRQGQKQYKIIYMISDNVEIVKNLYELDTDHANKLIEYSSLVAGDDKVAKVSSHEQMVEKANEVITNGEIPVVVCHNSPHRQITGFHSETNFITCNSFEVSHETSLESMDYLDMRAILTALNKSYNKKTLSGFYDTFTKEYTSYMEEKNRIVTMVYIGTGGAVAGGVAAIVYYYRTND